MTKILIANWKMNPASEAAALALGRASDAAGVVVCPPFLYLAALSQVLKKAELGAQNVFWQNPDPGGAFTGEISASQLAASGVRYVIVGHSERRLYLGESDIQIAKKTAAVLAAGLTPIVCVGESLKDYQAGHTKAVLNRQLRPILPIVRAAKEPFFLAYEPVWSISTFKTGAGIDPEAAHAILAYLQDKIASSSVQLLYGGSVHEKNLADFIAPKFVAGALVGGSSLQAEVFKEMIKIKNSL